MEARGAINQYMPYARGRLVPNEAGTAMVLQRAERPDGDPVFTLNLAAGVTPFIRKFHGKEYASQCYRITAPKVVVTHGNYRPTRTYFENLDEGSQDHVLNGGLLCAEIGVATAGQLPNDTVDPSWDYERFQEWCLQTYGKRRPPQ